MNEHEWIMTTLKGCDRLNLYLDPQPLNEVQEKLRADIYRRRQDGEPLQYILKRADFFDLALYVDRRVFIPRPETEILVDAALQVAYREPGPWDLILECGTGSGNIAISLARMLKKSRITALDVSRDALDVAALNARKYAVMDRISFVPQAWGDFIKSAFRAGQKFDMIISNPPYIPTDQISDLPADVRHEPIQALDGGADGLNLIRLIIGGAAEILRGHGLLAVEIGDGQHHRVKGLLERSGAFENITLIEDYRRILRVVIARHRPIPSTIQPGTHNGKTHYSRK